jgi:PAS domain S-box-containing protein
MNSDRPLSDVAASGDDGLPQPAVAPHEAPAHANSSAHDRPCMFERAFRDAPVLMAITDLETGVYVEVNEEALRVSGYSRDEVIGRTAAEIGWITLEDRATLANAVKSDGRVQGLEMQFRTKDGRTLRGWVNGEPLTMAGKRCLLSVTVDITEKKRAEEALRESRENAARLIETTGTGYTILDGEGKVLDANAEYLRLTGRKRMEDVVGHSIVEWTAVQDKGRNSQELHKCLEQGFVRDLEIDYVGPDGRVIPVEINATAFRSPGQVQILSLCRDITHRKSIELALRRSEERYRSFVANSSEAVWRFEAEPPVPMSLPPEEQIPLLLNNGYLAECNDAMARMYGFERAAELVGMRFGDMLPISEPGNVEFLNAAIRSGFRLIDAPSTEVDRHGNLQSFENSFLGVVEDGCLVRAWGVQRDVTARKRAEEALRESEQKYRALYENAGEAIFLMVEGKFIDCNAMALAMFGCTSTEQFVGRYPYDISPSNQPDGAPSKDAALRHIAEALSGRPQTFEWTHLRLDGSVFPAEVRLAAVEHGERIYLQAMVRDLTEKKRAEQAILENESFRRRVFESSKVAMGVMDVETMRYVDCNLAAARIHGLSSREELLLKGPIDVSPPQQPDGADSRIRAAELTGKALAVGSSAFEWRHRRPDGVEWDGEVHLRPYESEGRTLLQFTVQDVTERKRAEAALRESESLLRESQEIAGVGSYELDVEAGYWTSSDVLDRVFGIDKDFEHSVDGWWNIMHPEDRDAMVKYLLQEVVGKRQPFDREYRIVRQNDHAERWVHGLGRLETDAEGEVVAMKGTIMDVTDRKVAEQRILEANEMLEDRVHERTTQLESAIAELESFSYSISHDLKAPLRTLNGFSKILNEDYADRLDDEAKHLLCRIEAAADQMGALIDGIMTLSRASRGEMSIQSVDLSRMAEDVFAVLSDASPHRRVKVEIAPNMGASGDPRMLRSLLENILGNAWKYTANRENALIAFSCDRKGGELVFRVEDNGAGFDPEYSQKLFSPFQRLHSQQEYDGVGIGLATAQRIVQRHGGRIWAEGECERGAAFSFTLAPAKNSTRRRKHEASRGEE